MNVKTIQDGNASAGDILRFVLETKDGSGCLSAPYMVKNVTVYFVNREFTDPTASEYRAEFTNPEVQQEYEKIQRAVCIKAKQVVRAASVGNLSLSGEQTVDGIVLSAGDRVLAKDQTDKSENGLYVVSEGSWTRSSDANSGRSVVPGIYLFVENGIENIGTGWVLANAEPVDLGVTELNFMMFASDWSPESPDNEETENIRSLAILKKKMELSKTQSSFFYKDAVPVKVFGGEIDSSTNELFPAWLNPDNVPSELRSKVISDNILAQAEDENGIVLGKFILEWDTAGVREGDYFICWSWRPTVGDEVLSAHLFFHLGGNDSATTSIPTHRSSEDKYEMLLDRYTPEMFKTRISDSDLSPEVLSEFNKAVAKGFTFVENQANAVIDLLDANATHEQLLPVLANMFNLKIKSRDTTLWRRQIKKAVPNFKKKGSLAGLREALGDAGMQLIRLARMWQVVPKYTRQEHFVYAEEDMKLSMTPILDEDFAMWVKWKDGDQWIQISQDSISSSSSSSSGHWAEYFLDIDEDVVTWRGSPVTQGSSGRSLAEGDSLRFLYVFREMPPGEREKENYIRSLPLMDDRDERKQEYPPKNWNVHLIEEDDENFDVLVPVRHPLSDPIVWGRVRTEFPYGENLYNMEEYNGSKRDSTNPCDIDKEFMDSCGQCASSKFNIDVEIEMLSDDRFSELKQLVAEYMPFHAVPNSFGLWGSVNEFVRQSEETVRAMIHFSKEDITLAGEGQRIFNRDVYRSDIDKVRRDLLASMDMVGGTKSGTLRNSRILLLPRTTSLASDLGGDDYIGLSGGFDSININTSEMDNDPFESSNLLEILGSSTEYRSVSSIRRSEAELYGDLDTSMIGPLFEYRLSNLIGTFNVDISQHQEVIFNDPDTDFSILGIVSQYDVDSDLASGPAWKLLFENKQYSVLNVLPDGTLLVGDASSAVMVSGWRLMAGVEVKKEGLGGSKTTRDYGLVEINSPSTEVRKVIATGDYLYVGWPSSPSSYRVKSFQSGTERFYIQDYSAGGVGSLDVKVYRRVLDRKVGQFGSDRLLLEATEDLESVVSDGEHLVFVGGEYYTISGVDGNKAMLSGPPGIYGIEATPVNFNIYKFLKEGLVLSEKQVPPYDEKPPEYEFVSSGRSGEAIVTSSQGMTGAISSLLNSREPLDIMSHEEAIGYKVEYKEKK